ncbi:hypothetical protein H5410_054145 [Solanum commersonii]|uniref:Uncharacterized protein n=1 Tax=Solanum commersonii TaxID=4109 RepID=A0A9J5X8C6_SOLCO|nr:hypothetical protein H5410_054145 [Solanum commersonii]
MPLTSWSGSGTGSGHSFDAMPLWWHMNRRMGAGFSSSLAWKTSASKHSAAKRVQDCFTEWDGLSSYQDPGKGFLLTPQKVHGLTLFLSIS